MGGPPDLAAGQYSESPCLERETAAAGRLPVQIERRGRNAPLLLSQGA